MSDPFRNWKSAGRARLLAASVRAIWAAPVVIMDNGRCLSLSPSTSTASADPASVLSARGCHDALAVLNKRRDRQGWWRLHPDPAADHKPHRRPAASRRNRYAKHWAPQAKSAALTADRGCTHHPVSSRLTVGDGYRGQRASSARQSSDDHGAVSILFRTMRRGAFGVTVDNRRAVGPEANATRTAEVRRCCIGR